LKPLIDREVIEKQLHKLIHKIETGQKWEVLQYYSLLHGEVNYLEREGIELILLYVLNAFKEYAENYDAIEPYVDQNLFSTFGTHLTTEPLKQEFLDLICTLVKNYKNKDYVFYTAYDQLVNSVTTEKKEKIRAYVVDNLSSYYYEKFYEGYKNGNFLPF
jgi:hypothetical protein